MRLVTLAAICAVAVAVGVLELPPGHPLVRAQGGGRVTQEWAQRYDGPGDAYDHASDIAVDVSGNVYVTGESYGSSRDYLTIKYAPGGTPLWVRRYDGAGHDDAASAVAVDDSGNVYVSGESEDSDYQFDYATIKYAPDGTPLWVRRYDDPTNSSDHAWSIAVDASANVYVTGESTGRDHLGYPEDDYATVKYSPDGTQLWVRRYDGPGDSDDVAWSMAVDGSGNVYVTGESYGSDSGPAVDRRRRCGRRAATARSPAGAQGGPGPLLSMEHGWGTSARRSDGRLPPPSRVAPRA